MKKFYVGAYGIELIIIADIDLETGENNVAILYVRKPDGSEVTWVANIENDNEIHYIIKENDLDMPGIYVIQPVISYDDKRLYGSTITIWVYDKYD